MTTAQLISLIVAIAALLGHLPAVIKALQQLLARRKTARSSAPSKVVGKS